MNKYTVAEYAYSGKKTKNKKQQKKKSSLFYHTRLPGIQQLEK